jgi:hypothetical protein
MQTWMENVEEIAEHAHPITGNKARALHLLRNMKQAELAIKRMLGISEDPEDAD